MGVQPPKYLPALWDYKMIFDQNHAPDYARTFSDTEFILIPKGDDPEETTPLVAVYAAAIGKDFVQVVIPGAGFCCNGARRPKHLLEFRGGSSKTMASRASAAGITRQSAQAQRAHRIGRHQQRAFAIAAGRRKIIKTVSPRRLAALALRSLSRTSAGGSACFSISGAAATRAQFSCVT